MKPLYAPVLGLWNRSWLSAGEGTIVIGGHDTGVPKPDADFILCIARCLPSFVVMFNDTQVRACPLHCALLLLLVCVCVCVEGGRARWSLCRRAASAPPIRHVGAARSPP